MNPAWLDTIVLLVNGPALCSGVVVNPTGVVATAYHCVAAGGRPAVEWRDGTKVRGTVFARDPAHDLALVRVDRTGLPALEVREDDPAVGERVYGLGHPFGSAATGKLSGVLKWSVTEGIVSAVGEWVIQTDTALNPGNSGGPVVDAQGRIIGIASRKLNADNLSFLAKGTDLRELAYEPHPGSVVGGTWGVGLASALAPEVELGVSAWVSVRDRVVARAWFMDAPWDGGRVSLIGVAGLRQRVGRGGFSTTFDLGVGGILGTEPVSIVEGRVTVGQVGFGARFGLDGRFAGATLDFAWPGTVGVF